MSLQITVISLVSVSCTWSSRNFYLSLPWERGVALLQIPFCGGWTYIDKLIWQNSGISTNEEFSHVWLRTLGGGDYEVTLGYLNDRLDPWGTKGKFLMLTPGGVIPTVLDQGRQVRLWRESELDLLLACGIHSWLQDFLASPQLPLVALSRQVGWGSSFQAVSDSLGSVRGINSIYMNRLWHVLATKLLI